MIRPAYLHHRSRKFWTRVEIARSNIGRPRVEERASIFWPVVIGMIAAAMLVLSAMGCKSGHSSENISAAGTEFQIIGALNAQLPAHVDKAGKPIVEAIGEHVVTGQKKTAEANAEFAALDAKYTKLDNKWYVRWGRRIEAALWLIGIGWGISGIAGMAMMIFMGPAGAAIGAHILAFLPFSNFFLTGATRIKTRLNAPVAGAGGTV